MRIESFEDKESVNLTDYEDDVRKIEGSRGIELFYLQTKVPTFFVWLMRQSEIESHENQT